MNTYLLLAYITGGILVVYSLFLYIFPSRRFNLYLKAGSDLLSVINLLFVYLATDNPLVIAGMVTNAIGCVREIIFSFKEKSKVIQHIAWPIGFSIIFALSLIFTYRSPLSILPVVGSVVSTIAFYMSNPKLFKSGVIISCTLYIIYYAILIPSSDILTIFSLLCSVAGLISSVIGLIVLFTKKKKEQPEEEKNEIHSY